MANGNLISLDGHSLAFEDIVAIARGVNGRYPEVILSDDARKRIKKGREHLEQIDGCEQVIYGYNTGVGDNKSVIISEESRRRQQRKYIMTHACGDGHPAPIDVVRATMALRVNQFCIGNSGVTLKLCERILQLLNLDVIPVIPKFGSLGASGDLAPLAHIGAVLIGLPWTEVWFKGKKKPTQEVFDALSISSLILYAKEAMALTNGCTYTLAYGLLSVRDAEDCLRLANINVALGLEATRGILDAFDPRIHELRNQSGQIVVAKEIRRFIEGSKRVSEEARHVKFDHDFESCYKNDRVQDAYAFRCVPQAHGAVLDVINDTKDKLTKEINAATDNPLFFCGEKGLESLSGGNFHGDVLGMYFDLMGIALAKLGNISNARFFRLINRDLSYGLPQDLSGSGESDDNGFMIAHYTASALTALNRTLACPASTENIITAGGQEDYVSMAFNSAWKLRKIVRNTFWLLGKETLTACQGISLATGPLKEKDLDELGKSTGQVYQFIRDHIPPMKEDRSLYPDFQDFFRLIEDGSLFDICVVEEKKDV